MTRLNKILLVVNIAVVAALVLVVTVYAWNGPGAAPPTGGGAYAAATNAPASSVTVNASGNLVVGVVQGSGLIRSTGGTATGATGAGVELQQGAGFGLVDAYDRTAAAYQPLHFDGSTLTFKASGVAKMTMDASGNFSVGSGSGKIDVGTVDPIYTIGGARYATYLPGMTGVREETTGVAVLRLSDAGRYEYAIDFGTIERGSDLWLFWQTTDFGADWERLSVLLSPAFEGKVWYRKDQGGKRLTLYADKAGEVSYRLTAARFDHAEWPNASTGVDQGFVLDEK